MEFERLQILDVGVVLLTRHGDQRGFHSETYRADTFAAQAVNAAFVQDNHARSASKGVLRGLQLPLAPRAQGKLVRGIRGAIFDVAVDIRVGSPTYGAHVGGVRCSNDSALGIDWSLPHSEIILSQKDSKQSLLAEIPIPFRFVEGC
ncbi:dTDP-4-dehydrorhamnose 3,5-epimerase family protein [Bradyrhizobium sp. Ai1a-2]|uniref:dTDP-4-dehydrorhamnose 3,5-epimerase family protein n=1 Tax=Bradyrhizobium sp. Ai1a-2 TaxID=196490 RepID=UPI000480CA22|nr:dTDP-4-dehydrorhamnose 3,5-epimerase family protein [Bradyrhizobium sp. Ai1a-2]